MAIWAIVVIMAIKTVVIIVTIMAIMTVVAIKTDIYLSEIKPDINARNLFQGGLFSLSHWHKVAKTITSLLRRRLF